MAQEIKRLASFRKDEGLRRTKIVLGEGLFTSEEPEHSRRSKLAQPAFRKQEIDRYAASMVELTAKRARSWVDRDGRDGAGRDVELGHELHVVVVSHWGGSRKQGAGSRKQVSEMHVSAALTVEIGKRGTTKARRHKEMQERGGANDN